MAGRGRRAVRPDDKRLRRNRPPTVAAPATTRMQQLIDGDISVTDLDDDEVRRGRCRSVDGTFKGRPPRMLPRELLDALRQEYQRRNEEEWQAMAGVARRVLLEVATNPHAQADARVKAALAIAERAEGKVSEKIAVAVELKPFEQDLEGLLVDMNEGHEVVQGTVVPITRKQEAS